MQQIQQRIKSLLQDLAPRLLPYLTLKWIAIVTAGLLFIIYATLATIYVTETAAQPNREKDIDRLQGIISRAGSRTEEVEAEYKRVKAAIPPATLTETGVFEILLALARESGVIPQITFKGETAETIGGQQYRVLQLHLSATGPGEAVLNFFRQMDGEQKLLETLIVDNVTMSTGAVGTVQMTFNVYTAPSQK